MTGSPHWQPDVVARLRLVAEVFGNAMARQITEDALRSSEALKSAILTSLNSGVAVVDRTGFVIAVNERWHGLARESGLRWAGNGVGENLLAACERDAERCDVARRTLDGARAVLAGQAPRFVFQHSSGSLDATRYWMLSVHPLDHAVGGAVMSHTEITERKRAELDADLARAELAHMSRVSTIGELTASLAHELNQPLAAIVANAQAARRLYANNGRSADELPAVLNDIVDDGIRAGAVIQRTREMLRKETPSLTRLDLGALVRDVAVLVTNDALIRQVTLRLSLPHTPVFVDGDRIQLQQVLLNLLMNALEAIGDDPAKPRLINVRARSADDTTVDVEIRDTGPGLPTPVARVFDAFYTTKPSGMGMGLPIARSIVEAHGGSIHVANHPAGGAAVHFRLPLASEGAA
jgi:C4-dicarboxylate-specific signal transduction histidine kinase